MSSTTEKTITTAFSELICIITGNCVNSLSVEWHHMADTALFEYGRCFVTSNTLLIKLIKSRHINTKRWSYIQQLFNSLYADIMPNAEDMTSISIESDVKCKFKLSKDVIDKTLMDIKKETLMRIKETKKKKL